MACNIFGDTNEDIVDILEDVINNTNVDFDLFLTPSFERKQCSYNNLKTNRLVIANYDICTSIKNELFPSINDFIKDKEDLKIFVLTPHYLLNDSDFPTLFEYETIDFWVNQFKSDSKSGHLDYSEYENIFKSQNDFLRQKYFLVYLGSFRIYRQKLCQYLLAHYPDKNWISYIDVNKEIEDVNIKEPLDVYAGKSNPKIPNLGLFLSSYFSIIYDTIFDETYEDGDYQNVKFTDKIYRSIRMFHPFLYLGQYKALDKLKELGFKTFGGILDESYDELEVPEDRYMAILKQIDFIMSKDKKELFDLVGGVEEILYHNYNHIDVFAKSQREKLNKKLMDFLK
jgi:hypothetical protein